LPLEPVGRPGAALEVSRAGAAPRTRALTGAGAGAGRQGARRLDYKL